MPVFDFLGWRFVVAGLALAATRPSIVRALRASDVRCGMLLGVVLGAGYALQAIGLQKVPAAASGFITGLFVIFTPILAWLLLRERIALRAWFGVVVASAGLALITFGDFGFGLGEFITLVCAVCFALHIVGLGKWSAGRNAHALTVIQLLTAGVLSFAATPFKGGVEFPLGARSWLAIGITAILASALAYTVQTWAQARVSAAETAVILTMEPVFAAVFAVVLGGESLGVSALVGGTLVVGAMFIVQQPASTQGVADPQLARAAKRRPNRGIVGDATSSPEEKPPSRPPVGARLLLAPVTRATDAESSDASDAVSKLVSG
jgi:drug/metabolite transporter (DMT)-like permease